MKERVPPGQVATTKWPVLHYGDVPSVDTKTWTFAVSRLVERPFTLTYDELLALPRKTVVCDIHCVTRWSRLDNTFEGVPVQGLLARAGVRPAAKFCLVLAEQGFTTNLPLADLDRPENLIALKWGGEWLMPEHGWPARLLVPHLYFWKSAKWVRGFELLEEDLPGFRSEEHTSELQSQSNLVCRLLLEKKKKNKVRTSSLRELACAHNATHCK